MQLFKWTKAHSVFVPEFDEEHKAISRAAAEFTEAVRGKAPLFQVQEILHRLIAEIEDHLAHEERIMRAQRYPLFEWHHQQHETARKRVRRFAPGAEAGDPEASEALIAFLSQWLKEHLGLADRMLGAFVRNHERAHAA